jgi:hypothetical protein
MLRRRHVPGHAALSLALAGAAVSAVYPATALAQGERESLEAVRETTLALIELLVENGTLSREKADAMLAQARARAAQVAAAAPEPEKPVVRVPYIPQVVRDQIRSEIKEEVLAQAKIERWGVPNATAEWTDRVTISGDLRVRSQVDRAGTGNPSPRDYLAASLAGTTRAADFAAGNAAGLPSASTQDDQNRLRLLARLAINARVSDNVSAGLRLATGSLTDRVSNRQTLGQNFNRYQFLIDRAFIKVDATPWASVSAGRFANPWFSTDMMWSDNLNFDGVSAQFKMPEDPSATWRPFATLGYFPVRAAVGAVRSRAILGAQVGAQWEPSERTRVKFGLAQYSYNNFEGQIDPAYDAITGPERGYGQYQYEAGLRQRGNTLFLTNNSLEIAAGLTPDKALWGLASKFRPLALTAAVEFLHFSPYVIGLSGELVRNTAFDKREILARTGLQVDDARAWGVGVRGTIGAQQVRYAGDWQFSLGYRWLGSDAVPDAFVDSDLGGGGTNVRGVTAGVLYGIARDTQLGLRVLSGRTISSPTVQPALKNSHAVTSVQVDLNVSF